MDIRWRRVASGALAALALLHATASAAETATAASAVTVASFQGIEQALMDAVATGTRSVWERVLDDSFAVTSEEGEVLTRQRFLDELRPLPKGLSGGITVKELAVQEFAAFAVVRSGRLGEWIFVAGKRGPSHILNFRKFEPLVWTRIDRPSSSPD